MMFVVKIGIKTAKPCRKSVHPVSLIALLAFLAFRIFVRTACWPFAPTPSWKSSDLVHLLHTDCLLKRKRRNPLLLLLVSVGQLVSFHLLAGALTGYFQPKAVESRVSDDVVHPPRIALISLENFCSFSIKFSFEASERKETEN